MTNETKRSKKEKYEISKIIKDVFCEQSSEEVLVHDSFVRWLEEPENQEKDEILLSLWNTEEQVTDEQSKKAVFAELLEKIQNKENRHTLGSNNPNNRNKRPLRSVLLRVAAVVLPLLLVTGGWFYFSEKNENGEKLTVEWKVPSGRIEHQTLSDSSKVWINSDSKLTVAMDNRQRVAELSGEAYFSIAKDRKKKFSVKTEYLSVLVKGTKFNVEAYPDRDLIIVMLDEGRIEIVTSDERRWEMEPKQTFRYSKSTGKGEVSTNETDDIKGDVWIESGLVCENMTIREILNAVARKYDVTVEINNVSALPELMYAVEFTSGDEPEAVMEIIKAVVGELDYSIEGRKITIY